VREPSAAEEPQCVQGALRLLFVAVVFFFYFCSRQSLAAPLPFFFTGCILNTSLKIGKYKHTHTHTHIYSHIRKHKLSELYFLIPPLFLLLFICFFSCSRFLPLHNAHNWIRHP
jgi:hypothetical protein